MEREKGLNHDTPVGENPAILFPFIEEFGPAQNMRPGTRLHPAPCYYLFTSAGMGDYVNYLAAIEWVAQNCPWVYGTLFVSEFFIEFAEVVLSKYKNWTVRRGDKGVEMPHGMCVSAPNIMVDGILRNHQLLNATGAHLMDLGFAYYACKDKAPEGWCLPHVTFPEKKVPEALRGRAGEYVVFTPGNMVPARATTGKHLNPIIDYVKNELKLLPVFLGKHDFTGTHKTRFAEDINFAAGLDLREKTSLTQAAAACEYSAAVLGLDNGLLHLAACTKAPLIFGHNIAALEHRIPRRKVGQTVNLSLTKEELICISCQSNLKQMINFSFHSCLYGDTKCVDLLFANEGERWKLAFAELIKEST